MNKKLAIPAALIIATICFTGCSEAKYDGYLPDPKLLTNLGPDNRPTSMPYVSLPPADPNSVYNATPSNGTGINPSIDAGEVSTTSIISMPITPDSIGIKAGIVIQFNGKNFTPNEMVTAKVISTDNRDIGLKIEPSKANAEGVLDALKVYFPKNIGNGSYIVEFSNGATTQKTPVNIVSGF